MTKCLIVAKQTNKVKNKAKEKHSHEFNNLIEENIGFSMYTCMEKCVIFLNITIARMEVIQATVC